MARFVVTHTGSHKFRPQHKTYRIRKKLQMLYDTRKRIRKERFSHIVITMVSLLVLSISSVGMWKTYCLLKSLTVMDILIMVF